MQRSLDTSGGSDHIKLVKLASKKVIDEFDYLQQILIQYERTDISAKLNLSEKWYHRTNVSFEMRPDIIVLTGEPKKDKDYGRFISTTRTTIIEAETNPKNLFKNTFKIEAYRRIKFGSRKHVDIDPTIKFILACFDDAKLPKNTVPFDEVWTFARSQEEEGESR